MTHPQTDPALWSDTQAWLDDLDRHTGVAHAYHTEPDQLPTELDIDDRPHEISTRPPRRRRRRRPPRQPSS